MKIGIDIGKVIVGGKVADSDSDMFFTEDWLETPSLPNMFESIIELSQEHELFIISKCGAKIQERSMVWLQVHGFFERTGMLQENVHFVRKRHQKAPLAKTLGLDVFIDDREDVLSFMEIEPNIISHRILFTSWKQTMVEIRRIK